MQRSEADATKCWSEGQFKVVFSFCLLLDLLSRGLIGPLIISFKEKATLSFPSY